VLSLGVAILFCVVLSACFIQSAWASDKEDRKWSTDETAYACVEGNYTGLSFYEEYHYGVVTTDPEVGEHGDPYTKFRGGGSESYQETHWLEPGEWAKLTEDNSVISVRTTTYSGASEEEDDCTAIALITIYEP